MEDLTTFPIRKKCFLIITIEGETHLHNWDILVRFL